MNKLKNSFGFRFECGLRQFPRGTSNKVIGNVSRELFSIHGIGDEQLRLSVEIGARKRYGLMGAEPNIDPFAF